MGVVEDSGKKNVIAFITEGQCYKKLSESSSTKT